MFKIWLWLAGITAVLYGVDWVIKKFRKTLFVSNTGGNDGILICLRRRYEEAKRKGSFVQTSNGKDLVLVEGALFWSNWSSHAVTKLFREVRVPLVLRRRFSARVKEEHVFDLFVPFQSTLLPIKTEQGLFPAYRYPGVWLWKQRLSLLLSHPGDALPAMLEKPVSAALSSVATTLVLLTVIGPIATYSMSQVEEERSQPAKITLSSPDQDKALVVQGVTVGDTDYRLVEDGLHNEMYKGLVHDTPENIGGGSSVVCIGGPTNRLCGISGVTLRKGEVAYIRYIKVATGGDAYGYRKDIHMLVITEREGLALRDTGRFTIYEKKSE